MRFCFVLRGSGAGSLTGTIRSKLVALRSETMKSLCLTAALGMVCASSLGQGTLNFANSGPGLQAQVYDIFLNPLTGPGWSADLYWAPGVVADSTQLVALKALATFSTDPAQAGLFFGGPRTIIGAAGGALITAQIRVWDTASGSSWERAAIEVGSQIGQSIVFQVTLADPTSTPAVMTNLNGYPWQTSIDSLSPFLHISDAGVRTNQFGFNINCNFGGQVPAPTCPVGLPCRPVSRVFRGPCTSPILNGRIILECFIALFRTNENRRGCPLLVGCLVLRFGN